MTSRLCFLWIEVGGLRSQRHLLLAVLASVLLHVVWLMSPLPPTPPHLRDDQGLLQVMLRQHAEVHSPHPLQPAKESAATVHAALDGKPVPVADESTMLPLTGGGEGASHAVVINPAQPAADRPLSGRLRWHSPSYSQDELRTAMQQVQYAQQRASRAGAITDGMSSLSVRLRSALTGSIDCRQREHEEIDCQPAPGDDLVPLLNEFFNLASEAHSLGIAANPVRMELAPGQAVSITFVP